MDQLAFKLDMQYLEYKYYCTSYYRCLPAVNSVGMLYQKDCDNL